MKRIVCLCLSLLMLCGCKPIIKKVDSSLETATQMQQTLNNNENHAIFISEKMDGDEVFQSLESIYPYAFSMEFIYYPIRITEITVDIQNHAQQMQAKLLAEQIAKQQVEGLQTQEDMFAALHDYLTTHCQYDTQTVEQDNLDGTSAPFTAYGALVNGKAVCSGYARAFMMMCRAVGLDTIYISDSQMNHSWNAVMIDGEIFYIDCTFDDPIPDQGEKIIREYFLKTGDELEKTHTWDRDFYEDLITEIYGK